MQGREMWFSQSFGTFPRSQPCTVPRHETKYLLPEGGKTIGVTSPFHSLKYAESKDLIADFECNRLIATGTARQ
jgi:hypothetical protein